MSVAVRVPDRARDYRQLFGMGNGRAVAMAVPTQLLDALRFAADGRATPGPLGR
jgi:hypothetical protein